MFFLKYNIRMLKNKKIKLNKSKTRLKRGEMYIDTVITLFLSMVMIFLSINIFSLMYTYSNVNNIAENLIDYVSITGCTEGVDFNKRVEGIIEAYGYKKQDISLSFDGSNYISGKNVQYGENICLTVSTNKKISFTNSTGVLNIPVSVRKIKMSKKYFSKEELDENLPESLKYKGVEITEDVEKGLIKGQSIANGFTYTYKDFDYVFCKETQSSVAHWICTQQSGQTHAIDELCSSICGYPVTSYNINIAFNLGNEDNTEISVKIPTSAETFSIEWSMLRDSIYNYLTNDTTKKGYNITYNGSIYIPDNVRNPDFNCGEIEKIKNGNIDSDIKVEGDKYKVNTNIVIYVSPTNPYYQDWELPEGMTVEVAK